MSLTARLLGLLVVILAGAGLAPAPAAAAYCSTSGVHVVVDFGALGGGVRQGCMATDSRVTGDRAFRDAGFALSYVSTQPGAVCRVSGRPASAGCSQMPPGNAYWGLFESHGGGWNYSNTGVGGVRLEPGDSVAFVWQNGGGTERPGVKPGRTSFPDPKPTPKPPEKPPSTPTPDPSSQPTVAPGTSSPTQAGAGATTPGTASGPGTTATPPADAAGGASPSATSSASANPKTSPSASSSGTPGAPAGDATGAAEALAGSLTPRGEPAEEGLPGWAPVGLVVVLSGAAAAAVAVRRRTH